MLVFRTAIFADQQSNVFHLVVILIIFNVSVVLHLSVVPLAIAANADHLSFVLASKCLHHSLRIEICPNYFWSEGIWSL